jgi:hypothetical protein
MSRDLQLPHPAGRISRDIQVGLKCALRLGVNDDGAGSFLQKSQNGQGRYGCQRSSRNVEI